MTDEDKSKTDLRLALGASSVTVAKLTNGEFAARDVQARICKPFHCGIGDIMTGGVALNQVAGGLLSSIDPDVIEEKVAAVRAKDPKLTPEAAAEKVRKELAAEACKFFTGGFNENLLQIRKAHDQIIDDVNVDSVAYSGWDKDAAASAQTLVDRFKDYIKAHRTEVVALDILYGVPHRRRELTIKIVKELATKLEEHDPALTAGNVWRAFHRLGIAKTPAVDKKEPSLVRYVAQVDKVLTPFVTTIDANFKARTFKYNAEHPGARLTEEQMAFLRMIRDHVASSFHISTDDMEYAPFDGIGGPFRFRALFGDNAVQILELNVALAA